MNGCLVAFRGEAAIFVDGTLAPEESRVIIAHEFGHFLADYEWPRLRALRNLGERIVEVLDGHRAPAANELLGASLTDVPLGVFTHYMDRCQTSDVTSLVSQVEETANIVGAELLAPRHVVLAELVQAGSTEPAAMVRLLEKRFGLPTAFASWYAGRLVRHLRRRRSFSDILGFARSTAAMES